MMWFKKKREEGNRYNVVTEHYVPASLPVYGMALETYVTSDYPMEQREEMETTYGGLEKKLMTVLSTTDQHSAGTEFDQYVDNEMEHIWSDHMASIAEHEKQIVRINNARSMRMADLDGKISASMQRRKKLEEEIHPLEDLQSHFQLHFGNKTVSIGLIITILAMVIDAAVNYSFLQTILLSNVYLLGITVVCMSVMSDLSMLVLAHLFSLRNEKLTAKPLFWSVCAGLFSMFVLSVVASVMIRLGSMDATYGTINAAGEFVGKESYSLAEYGTTLITAFLTTGTGILSFAFSVDDNAHLISVREQKKAELAQCEAELEVLMNEKALLENAPDPAKRDALKRAAAERHIEALHKGLKLHLRKLMTERIADADFTEKMAASGKAVLNIPNTDRSAALPVFTTANLNKVS